MSIPNRDHNTGRMTSTPARSNQRIKTLGSIWLLFVLVSVVHGPGLAGGFLSDDCIYIKDNYLMRSFSGLTKLWTEPRATSQYYPLTFTTFWIEYQLWGPDATGYHVVNILMHALNAVLVYIVLRSLKIRGALVAAAIFGLHPVNVSSVGWVAERKNLLSTAFYLASLLCCVRFLALDRPGEALRRSSAYCAAGLILFGCALLSKTMTCTLPLVILILMWWRGRRLDRRAIIMLAPMFAMATIMGRVTVWAERRFSGGDAPVFAFSLVERILVAGRAIWHYAVTLVAPLNLSMVHTRWTIETGVWWWYLFPLLSVSVLISAWMLRGRIGKGAFAALLMFVVTLAPVLGLVSFAYMQHSFVADHLVYLPCIVFITLCVSLVTGAVDRSSRSVRDITFVGAIIVTGVLGLMTWNRSTIYSDEELLWNDTIAKNPRSFMALNSRGAYRVSRGDVDRGIADYNKSIESNPRQAVAYHNRANAYCRKGNIAQAMADYTRAISLRRGVPGSRVVESYAARGALHIDAGNFSKAAADFTKAIEFVPWVPKYFTGRGEAYSRMGKYAEAIADYTEAIRLNPNFTNAWSTLGIMHLRTGHYDSAIESCARAIELNPTLAPAYYHRAAAYQSKGQYDLAIADLTKLIELIPPHARAYCERAVAHHKRGDHDRALVDLDKALQLDPGYVPALAEKADILTKQGKDAQLIQHWRGAVQNRSDSPTVLTALAWLLATHEEAKYRDGDEAVKLTEKACELTARSDPAVLNTLAAAYAETGRFEEAVTTIEKALRLLSPADNQELRAQFQARLELYKARHPYRERPRPTAK